MPVVRLDQAGLDRAARARGVGLGVQAVAQAEEAQDRAPVAEWMKPHWRIHRQASREWLQGSSRSWLRNTRDARP